MEYMDSLQDTAETIISYAQELLDTLAEWRAVRDERCSVNEPTAVQLHIVENPVKN